MSRRTKPARRANATRGQHRRRLRQVPKRERRAWLTPAN
jgi:hypothetical protein